MRYLKFSVAIVVIFILLQGCKESVKPEVIEEETPWGTESFSIPNFGSKKFSIVDFGAKPESGVNNQKAIQSAINKCNSAGGGTVIVPAGKWETSFITLKSNVNLHLEKESELIFSDNFDLYKAPTFTRWEGIECVNYHPLIYAKDARNIGITGSGKINGNGKKWWFMKSVQVETLSKLYDQVQANIPPEKRNCLDYENGSLLRPSLIQTLNCKNVLIDSIQVGSGPMWTIHFVYCENVVARNINVVTVGTNNDGITPDACKKVLIDNCKFSTGDDCIVIKSGLNEDGWRVGKASERIVIKNCKTKNGNGGVVIGSEMSGGVKNVYAHNCDFSGTLLGLRVKSMKGRGGVVENIWFKDIRMDSIKYDAIRINMDYKASSIAPRTTELPVFRNFHFENIYTSHAQICININGIYEQKIENITFKNIKMKGELGVKIDDATNCQFNSSVIESVNAEPLQIIHSDNIRFNQSKFISPAETMMLAKDSCKNINLSGTNSSDYKTPFIVDNSSKSGVTVD